MLTLTVDTIKIVEIARYLGNSFSQTLLLPLENRSWRVSEAHRSAPTASHLPCSLITAAPLAVSLRKLCGCSLQLIVLAQILTQIKKSKEPLHLGCHALFLNPQF